MTVRKYLTTMILLLLSACTAGKLNIATKTTSFFPTTLTTATQIQVYPTTAIVLPVSATQLPPTKVSTQTTTQPSITISRSTATLVSTPTRKPTRTLLPSVTPTPIPPATSTPGPSVTFDASRVITRTPAPPAICPRGNPDLVPDFSAETLKKPLDFPRLEEPILKLLNNGGTPNAVIKALEWTDTQGLAPDYIYDFSIKNKDEFNNTHLYEKDLTGDGVPELVISRVNLYIFGCNESQYQTLLSLENDDWGNQVPAPWIISTTDIDLDNIPEIIVKSYAMQTEVLFRIFEWNATGFKSLIVTDANDFFYSYIDDVVSGSNAQARILDIDNNGTKELIVTGGVNPLVLSSPTQRAQQFTYTWDGNTFALISNVYSPPKYRFEAVQDGDRYSLAGNYKRAYSSYQDVIFNDKLEWWSEERNRYELSCNQDICGTPMAPNPDPNEYPNLAAYARFRILLLFIKQGYKTDAQTIYNALQQEFPEGQPGYAYAKMAQEFWNEYQVSQNIGLACSQPIDYAANHPKDVLAYLGSSDYEVAYFGDQSLTYRPEDICPFK